MSRRVLCVVFVCALAACTGHGRSVESKTVVPQPPGDLQGTTWKLVAKNDNDAVPPAQQLTLHIDNGRARGRGPCSSYRMPFRNHGDDGEDVTTGRLVSLRGGACPARLVHKERTLFRDLAAVDRAEKQAGRLVLTGPHDTWLSFERMST